MKFYLFIIAFVFYSLDGLGQDTMGAPDTGRNKVTLDSATSDTSKNQRTAALDTLSTAAHVPASPNYSPKDYSKLLDNPYFNVKGEPVYIIIEEREHHAKDELFYLVSGLLLFLSFIKLVFSKYFNNIFRLFFQPSFRQKQTREQLMQSNLPALLFNLFFIASASAYVALLIGYFNLVHINFWWLFLYCAAAMAVLYFSKLVFLTFSGWVFNVKEATDTYIFIVYLINKILGVVLVPFILVIAFSRQEIIGVSVTMSLLVLALLFIYRYIVSYAPVRKEVKVSPLHFFFYICAFEIIPLLLINKFLMIYLNRTL